MCASRRGRRLIVPALTAVALAVAPFSLSVNGPVVAKAYAGKGGNGNGGNGNGNGGGNNGNGNSGNGNGNSGGNNGNGNGNSGGNNGNSNGNSGNSSGNGDGDNGNSSTSGGGTSTSAASAATVGNHVNAYTGDKVEFTGKAIQVTHPNGMKERIENGRFRMEDKYGRTIVDRKATMADVSRLKSL